MGDVDKLREHADWLDDIAGRGPGRIPTSRMRKVASDLRRIAASLDDSDPSGETASPFGDNPGVGE